MLARGVRALHPRSLLTLLTRSCCWPPEGSELPGLRRSCRMTTGSPAGLCRIPQSSLVEKGAKKAQNTPEGPIHSPGGGVIVLQGVRSRAELTP